jgi:predicted transcriptional regulator
MKGFYDKLNICMDPELTAWLDEYAARTCQTRSIVTRQALTQMQLKDKIRQRRPIAVESDVADDVLS